jgi:metal-responsive CopG/Arc/MetJ family transcriptional regulator
MKKKNYQENYVTLKVPKALADEIDRILKSGTLGYRSRTELIVDVARRRIEELSSNNTREHSNFKQNKKEYSF